MTDTAEDTATSSEKLNRSLEVATKASAGIICIRCPPTEAFRVVETIQLGSVANNSKFRLWSQITGWGTFETNPEGDILAAFAGDEEDATFNPIRPTNSTKDYMYDMAFGKMPPMRDDDTTTLEERNPEFPDDCWYVMVDAHYYYEESGFKAYIRRQAQRSYELEQRLFIVMPDTSEIPDDIAPFFHIIDYEYPNQAELSQLLELMVEGIEEEDQRPDLTAEEVRQLSLTGLGMTKTAFENAVALSLTDWFQDHSTDEGDEPPTYEHISKWIRNYKVEVLRKTDVLELQEGIPVDDIGGLQNFKDWMEVRKSTYDEAAVERGITPSRGVLVVGVPGCKAAGTVINYRRGIRPSGRPITIEDFVAKFNGEPVPRSRPWEKNCDTFVQSWDAESGAVFYNRVLGAYHTGRKAVIRIETDGDHIDITNDDSVLMADGTFKEASQVRPGDLLLVRGSMKPIPQGGRSVNRPRVVVEGLRYYEGGWDKEVHQPGTGLYAYKRQHRAVLVVEAHMNGLTYDEYIYALKSIPNHGYRERVPDGFEVHHIDENPMNDNLGNLQVIPKTEHLSLHRQQSMDNLNVEYTVESEVISVSEPFYAETYDLQMENPACNFVVNGGIIAHNTGKSLIAKASGSMLGLPVIRFDIGRVFGSFIGQSESRMRAALKLLDAMAPLVVMVDEIDKGFAGMSGGGNDGGTSMRVFGTFLTWMQERPQKTRPIFCVFTANRVNGLPPELMRPGRIDEKFAVNAPNADERADILRIHSKKRKLKIKADDMPRLVALTDRMVGAEIEALVEQCLIHSYSDDTDTLSVARFSEERAHMKLLADSFKENIDAILDWTKKYARQASADQSSLVAAKKAAASGTKIIKTGRRPPGVKPKPKLH